MPEVSKDQLPGDLIEWSEEIDEIMGIAVANAIEENRRRGLYPETAKQDSVPTARVAEDTEGPN